MVDAAIKFDRDLKKFARRINADLLLVTKKVALDIFSGVVKKTPVDKGRARASWNINAGSIDDSVESENDWKTKDKASAARASKKAQSKTKKLAGLRPYTSIFITNNLPYIVSLEEGSSTQAPKGMVKLTVEEVKTFIGKGIT